MLSNLNPNVNMPDADQVTRELFAILHRGGAWRFVQEIGGEGRRSYWSPVDQPFTLPRHLRTGRNVYFGVNPTSVAVTDRDRAKYAGKNDAWIQSRVGSKNDTIAAVNCVFSEFDGKSETAPTGEESAAELAGVRADKQRLLAAGEIQALPGEAAIFNEARGRAELAKYLTDPTHYNALALSRLRAAPLPASVVWCSGGGYQALWLLDETFVIGNTTHLQWAAWLQSGWVAMVGGDPGVKDLRRILRLPGTQNVKPAYAPDFPTVHYVDVDFGRRYSREDLVAHLPARVVAAPVTTLPAPRKNGAHGGRKRDGESAIELFNIAFSISDMLDEHGYSGQGQERSRPGQPGSNGVNIDSAANVSFHWSSNDPLYNPTASGTPHAVTPFTVLCQLNYAGDLKAAVVAAKKMLGIYEEGPALTVTDPSTGKPVKLSRKQPAPAPVPAHQVAPDADKIADRDDNPFNDVAPAHAATPPMPMSFNFSDLGNARRMVNWFGRELMYVHAWDRWYIFDGSRWMADATEEIFRVAKRTVARMYEAAADIADDEERKALVKWALSSESSKRLSDMVRLARSEQGIAASEKELDGNHMLLNCLNGTIDLRTGKLRAHERGDRITKRLDVTYNPNAQCPTWLQFLDDIMLGDQPMIDFLQRAIGYTLTGDTSAQSLFFMYGAGSNGKSTFIQTLMSLLGAYAQKAPTEMILQKYGSPGIPNDLARLPGARLVCVAEMEENRRLAESTVKDLTGGDTISARFMRGEWFEFMPTHKLWMYGNHKPVIVGTDNGIWRRIHLVPFLAKFEDGRNKDDQMPARLRAEYEGILAWAVTGCLLWQRDGLKAPAQVLDATRGYRDEMDTLKQFIVERCFTDTRVSVKLKDLREAYERWCVDGGHTPLAGRKFGNSLTDRGYEAGNGTGNVAIRKGIALLKVD